MPLKIYKRGDIWHYRGQVAGRRLRGSCGTADKETASRFTAEIEGKQWRSHFDGPQAVLTFAQASMLYRGSGKTTRFLEKIEDYWKDTLVKNITAGAVRQSAMTLYPKAANSTRNRQVIVPVQAVINHAAESELCPHIRVKRLKEDSKIKTPVTLEWVEAFKAHAKPHLGTLALFMFLTGARISEACAVEWSDVDLKNKTVLIRQTKQGNERKAHLPQKLVVALANLPKVKGRPVFWYRSGVNAIRVWASVCKRAKIPLLTYHSCRHGFATALLHAGIDPVTTAKLGGWKSTAHVFRTYGHASDDTTLTDLIADTPKTQRSTTNESKARKSRVS